jgi:HAMP domain-containing protein
MLMPIGFEDNFFLFWLLQIVLAIVIQLVFNRWLINRLQQIRARN